MDKILVVDDEKGVRHSFKKVLERHGYKVVTAANGLEAIEQTGRENPVLVIMDVSMPKMDGLETLQKLRSLHPDLTIIMMTANSTSDKAISAMKFGAYDYLMKPFDNDQLLSLLEKAIMDKKMSTPVTFSETTDDEKGDRIIGKSPAMLEIFKKIGQIAGSDVTVLLNGETGTGKELIARAIYQHSKRVNRPFLPMNCSAIPEALLESELFGHEKGAFTSADNKRIGKFEQCDTGTMFLDEIGDMPMSIQAKWLRVLQDGTIQRLGGKDVIKTDVRIIAATNKNLEDLKNKGEFREDLYWRLNVVTINLPPLRERKDDIENIANYFIRKYNRELDKNIKGISPELTRKFHEYNWPGNVRELQSIIQRGMVICQKDLLSVEDCESLSGKGHLDNNDLNFEQLLEEAADKLMQQGSANIYKKATSALECILIKKALEQTGQNQVSAAKLLGIARETLRKKLDTNK